MITPDLHTRAHRVLDLYDHPPAGGRVICLDELGPLRLQPRKGQPWRHTTPPPPPPHPPPPPPPGFKGPPPPPEPPPGPTTPPPRPRNLRPRRHGVMYLLAALDLTTGRLHYRIRRRQRHHELLDLLRSLRARWPHHRLHLVLDNFAPHHHPAVRDWAEDNNAELVYLPTYSSWLNWIEAEFTALRYFTLNGTHHHSHAEQNTAIANYIRRRNNHAHPKTDFATDSPVRTWLPHPAKTADTTSPPHRTAPDTAPTPSTGHPPTTTATHPGCTRSPRGP
ncbi:IS630 family transposase [Actinosynnema sp. NPDC059797]